MAQDRLAMLLQFYEEDPSDSFTRFALAQEYRKRGETAEAVTFFERLIEDDPSYTGAYYHLGKLHEEAGRTEEAIEVYERGIEVAQAERALKDLSELRDALMNAQGIGFDE